jgi:hypothetical protein
MSRPVLWLCINYTARALRSVRSFVLLSPCAGFEPFFRLNLLIKNVRISTMSIYEYRISNWQN